MVNIIENLARVKAQIQAGAIRADRNPNDVKLMLAVKYQPAENIISVLEAGENLLGHNLVPQLLAAEPHIAQYPHYTTMIGHVQSNKLSAAMEQANRIDTVDSLKMAERINRRQQERIANGVATMPYPILLQVNSSGASTQFGCEPNHLIELAQAINALPYVQIQGLMTIGANSADEQKICDSFTITRNLSLQMQQISGLEMAKELSMGMTGDMELAIAQGSTTLRVGTAIFGARPAK